MGLVEDISDLMDEVERLKARAERDTPVEAIARADRYFRLWEEQKQVTADLRLELAELRGRHAELAMRYGESLNELDKLKK